MAVTSYGSMTGVSFSTKGGHEGHDAHYVWI